MSFFKNLAKKVAGEAPYGFCPICGAPGRSQERRPNGIDECEKGHRYYSKDARNWPSL